MRTLSSSAAALAFFASLLVLGCGDSSAPARDPSARTVIAGSILPLTGDGAAYGVEIRHGIELAVEHINETGGLGGPRFQLTYEDSRGDPTTAVSALQSLRLRNSVAAVIGDSFSGATLALVPVIDRDKIVLLSPTASSPKLTAASPFFFRVWPSDTAEATKMADFALATLSKSAFAVLYSNSEYGVGLRNAFVERVTRGGARLVADEAFREKDTDFRTQLQKIKSRRPDAVYITGYYQEFALILKQARELALRTQFLSCGTFHEPQVIPLAAGGAEGVIFVQPYYDPASTDPRVVQFVTAFRQRNGSDPGLYAAHGYDAALVLAEAMRKASGDLSADSIRRQLEGIRDFPGVTGKTTFEPGGDVKKEYRLMTVRDGRFVGL
jgi:branched-chain amino acid transport system substrate-binding protein